MTFKLVNNVRNKLVLAAVIGSTFSLSSGAQSTNIDDITFTTWTGPYMRSQMLGFVRPYEESRGVTVDVEGYGGGIDQIRDQVESANVTWDVVDLTQADSLRACEEGLLENLEGVSLPNGKDGTPAGEDFVEGALNKCGVGVIVWSTAFAYNKNLYTESQPSSIADFFDTKTFPGKRAIRGNPSVIMEWALIADGVAPDDVYKTLETPEGVERALSKMNAIRAGLTTWSKGKEPIRMLNSEEVAMSMIWGTTGATAAKMEGANFELVWDGRVIEQDLFGIPKGSPNKDAALDFIRFASNTESLANMVSYLPNGPTRKSSLAILSDDILEQLPNSPKYEDQTHLRSDAQWWSDNYARINESFDKWLSESTQKGASGTVR